MTRYQVIEGDNMAALAAMADCSVDSVCTDPPYGLGKEPDMVALLSAWLDHGYLEIGGSGFMGKQWDAFVPQPIFWKEVFRVLKPGGYVVSFGGTRTYDLMVLAVRLAGFEVRDQLVWLYGSGFPKSANVSKMIDKQAGAAKGERTTIKAGHEKHVGKDNMKALRESGALSGDGGFSRPWMHDPQKVEDAHWNFAPSTDEAKEWDGWGTALSPSHEPIVMARKPLDGTVAQNVLKWGTGALNIAASRVVATDGNNRSRDNSACSEDPFWKGKTRVNQVIPLELGRWPSNLIHDGSGPVMDLFPENATSGKMGPNHKRHTDGSPNGIYGKFDPEHGLSETFGDTGSAARYFYCAKPSQYERSLGVAKGVAKGVAGSYEFRTDGSLDGKVTKERNNFHPTVKPVALMHHLVGLVTPPNGVCLDPFCGSGTTGIGAMLAGDNIRFIGLEMTEEYVPIAVDRLKHWRKYRQFVEPKKDGPKSQVKASSSKGVQTTLF